MTEHAMSESAAVYALDALEGADLTAFEQHIADCAICQMEVAEFRAATSALIADEPASAETWMRISTAISRTDNANVVPLSGSTPSSGSGWKWVAGVAAAAALLFGGVLVTQMTSRATIDRQDIVSAAQGVSEEPGSIVGEFLVEDLEVAQIVLSPDGRGFVIPTDDLEALDESRTYQLWVINDTEEVISAGILGADPGPVTFTWTGKVTGFALTREVAGGVVSSAGDVVSVITDV